MGFRHTGKKFKIHKIIKRKNIQNIKTYNIIYDDASNITLCTRRCRGQDSCVVYII